MTFSTLEDIALVLLFVFLILSLLSVIIVGGYGMVQTIGEVL